MKKDNEKIDIPRLNEVIKTGSKILKVGWALILVGVILLVTFLIKEWKIFDFLGAIFNVISPLFIGIVIAWLLDPLVCWLEKKGIKRVLASIIIFVSLIGLIVLFFVLMIPSLTEQVNEFIAFAPNILEHIKNIGEDIFSKLSTLYDIDFSNIKDSLFETIANILSSITVDLPNKIINIASSVVSGGLNIVFGLFIGLYMLFDFNNIRKHLMSFLPKRLHSDAITLTDCLNKTLRSYVHGTLLIMLMLFVFQSIALGVIGLSSPMLFGLFCAITNVIPYFGPYIGGIPAVVVGFTINPVTGFGVLIAIVLAQFLESYFLNPIVMSKTMKLHPVTIMLGLLIFGHFFGILGMILATPIISCIKVIANFFNEKYEIINSINNK